MLVHLLAFLLSRLLLQLILVHLICRSKQAEIEGFVFIVCALTCLGPVLALQVQDPLPPFLFKSSSSGYVLVLILFVFFCLGEIMDIISLKSRAGGSKKQLHTCICGRSAARLYSVLQICPAQSL